MSLWDVREVVHHQIFSQNVFDMQSADDDNVYVDERYRTTRAVSDRESLAVLQFTQSANLSTSDGNQLIRMVSQEGFDGSRLSGRNIDDLRRQVTKEFSDREPMVANLTNTDVDGDQNLVLYYRLAVDVAGDIFGDSDLRDYMSYSPKPVWRLDGERLLTNMPSGTYH